MDKLENSETYFEDSAASVDEAYNDDLPLPETDNKRWELDYGTDIALVGQKLFSLKLVNKTGVENIMFWLYSVFSKANALTNFRRDDINMLVLRKIKVFNNQLREKTKLWSIKDAASRSVITDIVEGSLFAQYCKALDDGERKYRKESYGYNESYRHDEVRNDEIGTGFRLPFFGGKKKQKQPREYEEDRF